MCEGIGLYKYSERHDPENPSVQGQVTLFENPLQLSCKHLTLTQSWLERNEKQLVHASRRL